MYVSSTRQESLVDVLATVVPEWLSEIAHPDWFKRYETRIEASRLPEKTTESEQWVLQVGADGHQLLAYIYQPDASKWLRQIPAVEILRQIWVQQYYIQAGQLIYIDRLSNYLHKVNSSHHPMMLKCEIVKSEIQYGLRILTTSGSWQLLVNHLSE